MIIHFDNTGNEYDCKITYLQYQNGNTAIRLVSNDEYEEPIATVNFGDVLPKDQVYIKDYSENCGVEDSLIRNGIIEQHPIGTEILPHTCINKYRLTQSAMEELNKQLCGDNKND